MLAPESDSAPLLPNLPEPAVGMPPLVAAISGSTMQGFLYSPHYGIAQVAEWRLRQSLAEEFEVTNLAMTRASLAVAAAEFKKLDRQPDLPIVYSSHNEFFHELLETGWVGFGN